MNATHPGGQSLAGGPPPLSLVDPLTGLLPTVIVGEMDPADPDVFVCATDTVELEVYGSPYPVSGKGSGAGLTYEAALGAAVGEGIERYAFSVVHPEDLVVGSHAELTASGRQAVGPERWALFEEAQYRALGLTRFETTTKLAWIVAESVTHRQERLVPACFVFVPYTRPFAAHGEETVGVGVSTGAACGRTRLEALLKGLCELVERDAFMIMWRNRLPRPRVQIDPQSSLYETFQTRFARPGLEYVLICTTLDLAIPSFVGILLDRRPGRRGILVGGAAHPDPAVAALKTLLELVQGLKWKDYHRSTFEYEPGFANVRTFEDRACLYATTDLEEATAFLLEGSHQVALSSIPSLDQGDSRLTYRHCVELLGKQGLEVLAVDVTPVDVSDCGLHVVRTLIPGCEIMEGDHRAPLLGGWRWRDVPKRLGLAVGCQTAEGVNPYPHPYP